MRLAAVILGLDPRIHLPSRAGIDPRVKPEDDEQGRRFASSSPKGDRRQKKAGVSTGLFRER